jgi:hypothetical protein
MKQERIVSDRSSSTFVHEIGHWMGLRHTFGKVVESQADDCKSDDGLLRTTLTPGWDPMVYNCTQTPCDGRPEFEVKNWMSVGSSLPLTDALSFFLSDVYQEHHTRPCH